MNVVFLFSLSILLIGLSELLHFRSQLVHSLPSSISASSLGGRGFQLLGVCIHADTCTGPSCLPAVLAVPSLLHAIHCRAPQNLHSIAVSQSMPCQWQLQSGVHLDGVVPVYPKIIKNTVKIKNPIIQEKINQVRCKAKFVAFKQKPWKSNRMEDVPVDTQRCQRCKRYRIPKW